MRRTFRLTGPRGSALVRYRQRPWLRLNRWFATQGKPTSIVCPDRDTHSTGAHPLGPSDEAHRTLISLIRTRSSTKVDRRRIYLGIDLEPSGRFATDKWSESKCKDVPSAVPILNPALPTECSYGKRLLVVVEPSQEYWSRESVHRGNARKRRC